MCNKRMSLHIFYSKIYFTQKSIRKGAKVMTKPIPVTIITGFLGSGKTTLINHILNVHNDNKVAVIINEFGDISVDHRLVLSTDEDIYQMANGCLCCTLRTDIADMLRSILEARENEGVPIEQIIIETTGLADPAPLVQTFFNLPFLKEHFTINSIITLVDCVYGETTIKEQDEPVKQISFADRIYLTKADLVTRDDYEKLAAHIHHINPFAPVSPLDLETITMSDILDQSEFMMTESQLKSMTEAQKEADAEEHEHEHDHDHEHDHEHHHHHHGHDHHHGITTCSIEVKEPLELTIIQGWLNELISYYGPQLYRYKGILSIKDVPNQIIIQGVQMSCEVSQGREWKNDADRSSTLVFIGKNLPTTEIEESFKTCIADYIDDNPYHKMFI